MKEKINKRVILLVLGACIGVLLWQVLVIELVKKGVISSIIAALLLCLCYVVIGCSLFCIVKSLLSNMKIILGGQSIEKIDRKEKEKIGKLINMVTHNPELAEEYSTRIIRILDGEIKADSQPLSEADVKKEKEAERY